MQNAQIASAIWLRGTSVPQPPPSDLELHAELNSRLLSRGDTLQLGRWRCTVARTTPSGGGVLVVHRTAVHLEAAPAAAATPSSPPIAVFAGQRHAYEALSSMVRGFTTHGAELRSWHVRPPAGLLLYGPPGTGKTHVVRAVASTFELPLLVLQGDRGGSSGGGLCARLRSAFAQAEAEAEAATVARGRVTPALLFLDEIDTLCPKRSDDGSSGDERRAVAQLLTLLDGVAPRKRVIAVAATNRSQAIDEALRRPGRLEWEVPLALPSRAERRQALEASCAALAMAADVSLDDVAAACNGYAAADLLALAREAAMRAVRRASADDDDDAAAAGDGEEARVCRVCAADWREALRAVGAAVGREQLGLQGGAMEPLGWEEIGGLETVKRRLRRAVEWPLLHADAYRRLGVTPPKGVLLHGPPGCSKTSLARAAAGGAHASFYYLSGAALYSPYVGEAERRLREFFALGRATSPAILFLDELEALVGGRDNGAGGGGDEVQLRVLSTLLNEMDGVAPLERVLLIGATNRPDLLDAALLRPGRFDEQLLVPPPDEAGRGQVLAVHTRRMPLAADVELGPLAARTAGWSGAQLAALCREAGMEALRGSMDAADVRHAHFEAAFARVHAPALSGGHVRVA